MDQARGRVEKFSRRSALAGYLLVLAAVLVLGLFLPSESAAHALHTGELRQAGEHASFGQPTAGTVDDSLVEGARALSWAGAGCSLASLEVPDQGTVLRSSDAGHAFRPLTTQPTLDIARAPPSPPPIESLRLQFD